MQLTPEQANILLSNILIIISVAVGGIITIIGAIITNSFQKKQAKIQTRKDIFQNRFLEVETFASKIMVSCRKLCNGILQKQTEEEITKLLHELLDVCDDIFILTGLRITHDEKIEKSVNTFTFALNELVKQTNDYLSVTNKKSKDITGIFESTSYLEGANAYLKKSLDEFRLNDFMPPSDNRLSILNIKKKSPKKLIKGDS